MEGDTWISKRRRALSRRCGPVDKLVPNRNAEELALNNGETKMERDNAQAQS